MLRCEECRKPIQGMMSASDQLSNLNAMIETLQTEESITEATARLMQERIQWLSHPVHFYEEHYKVAEAAGE